MTSRSQTYTPMTSKKDQVTSFGLIFPPLRCLSPWIYYSTTAPPFRRRPVAVAQARQTVAHGELGRAPLLRDGLFSAGEHRGGFSPLSTCVGNGGANVTKLACPCYFFKQEAPSLISYYCIVIACHALILSIPHLPPYSQALRGGDGRELRHRGPCRSLRRHRPTLVRLLIQWPAKVAPGQ